MAFGWPPRTWARCDGQLMPISTNQALFSLLGTTYGGNGQTTFALPDLRGRVPMHSGWAGPHIPGERAGQEAHTVTISELPQHVHFARATSAAATDSTGNSSLLLAQSTPQNLYGPAGGGLVAMSPSSIANVGGSQAHQNMQPFLTLSFCIALQGVFPSPN